MTLPSDDVNQEASQPDDVAVVRPLSTPWVTYCIIGLCTAIWVYFLLTDAESSPLWPVLVPNIYEIWHGQVWGLVTSAFVHLAIWHVYFNMVWARDFGRILEPTMGRWRYLAFVLAAAVVSSAIQNLTSDAGGIGFSGVVYAMFGYLLAQRESHPIYRARLQPQTVQLLIGWLVLCIVLTVTKVWNVGNGAHAGGLAFGWCLGRYLETGRDRRFVACLAALVLATVMSCCYVPWAPYWQNRDFMRGFYRDERLARSGDTGAQVRYGGTLTKWPSRRKEGMDLLRKAALRGDVAGMNELAWYLATASDDSLRNGQEALEWATKACRGATRPVDKAGYTDTLAAAFAEVGRWDEAIKTEASALKMLEGVPGNDTLKRDLSERIDQLRKHQPVRT